MSCAFSAALNCPIARRIESMMKAGDQQNAKAVDKHLNLQLNITTGQSRGFSMTVACRHQHELFVYKGETLQSFAFFSKRHIRSSKPQTKLAQSVHTCINKHTLYTTKEHSTQVKGPQGLCAYQNI